MHNVILSEAKDLLEDNMQGHYYVYMMGSASGRALYVGVTNDLQRRVLEHKNGETAGFKPLSVLCLTLLRALFGRSRCNSQREADQRMVAGTKRAIDRNDESGQSGSCR